MSGRVASVIATIRGSAAQVAEWNRLARESGMTLSQWARLTLDRGAVLVIVRKGGSNGD